jgi:hypothetical protein
MTPETPRTLASALRDTFRRHPAREAALGADRRCARCGRSGVPGESLGLAEDGRVVCLSCWLAFYRGPVIADPGPVYEPPQTPPPSGWRVQAISHLNAHGLPVEYGAPGRVGTLCPLCREGMLVEFSGAGSRYSCAAGCPEATILKALRAEP